MAEEATNRPRLAQRWPRFTIRGLLWTTTAVACLFPAVWFAWFLLLNASTPWGAHAVLGTGLLLGLAATVAHSSSGATRAFLSGFAAIGLAYFLLVVCDIASGGMGRSYLFDRTNLATTQFNQWAYREYVFPALVAKYGNVFPSSGGAPMDVDAAFRPWWRSRFGVDLGRWSPAHCAGS
jgi:hypothetical protein